MPFPPSSAPPVRPTSSDDRARRPRLPGVDAARGLAAFGVVVIHAGLVVGGAVTPAAGALSGFLSAWVVPFFLAAAFYFAAAATGAGRGARDVGFGRWLARTAGRLLVPYALWTVIYAGAKTAKLLLRHDPGRAWEPWRDPATLLLTGGGAVALYFLPLLFAGLLVGRALGTLPGRLPLAALLGLAVAAMLGADAFARSGNGFNLVTGRAFGPALGGNPFADSGPGRIVLALAADAVRCLPFVLLAAALARLLPAAAAARWSAGGGWLLGLGLAVFAGTTLPPFCLGDRLHAWPETLPGFGALTLAWACSLRPWPAGAARVAARLGAWSFGIYLAHQLVLEAMQLALGGRLPTPAGVAWLLAIAAGAFVACAAVIAVAAAVGGKSLRRLFALPD